MKEHKEKLVKNDLRFLRRHRKSCIVPWKTEDKPLDHFCKDLTDLSDTGNAWRLATYLSNRALFNDTLKCWLWWDGTRWNKEKSEVNIRQRAKERITRISEELNHDMDGETKKRVFKWIHQCQFKIRIDSMISEAKSHPIFVAYNSEFDQNPWLLNCLSGTIDLRTGKIKNHDPADMITKLCPVEWGGLDYGLNRDSKEARLWFKFLKDTTKGDKEFERFLQTAVGYSATGDTSEEKIFFVYGATATGKSTFLEAVKAALGDYAMTADFESFLRRRDTGGARPEIARLMGARMVGSIEVDEGRRLSEGLIKQLSGGDTMTVRNLYQNPFEIKPCFKLWPAANTAPKIPDIDSAMWRRFIRLPFDHSLSKRRQDPEVKRLLCLPEAGAVILSWLVRGALQWKRKGLGVLPEAVQESTKQYQKEMNPLKGFFDDRCMFHKTAFVKRSTLYAMYETYASQDGIRFPLTQQKFNKRIEERSCVKCRMCIKGEQVKAWKGVKVSK